MEQMAIMKSRFRYQCWCLLFLYCLALLALVPFANVDLRGNLLRLEVWTKVELVALDCRRVVDGELRAASVRQTSQVCFTSEKPGGSNARLMAGDRLLRDLRELRAMLPSRESINVDRLTALVDSELNQTNRLWEIWQKRSQLWKQIIGQQEPVNKCNNIFHCSVTNSSRGRQASLGLLAEAATLCLAIARESGRTVLIQDWKMSSLGLRKISSKCDNMSALARKVFTPRDFKKPFLPFKDTQEVASLVEDTSVWQAGIMLMYILRASQALQSSVNKKWKELTEVLEESKAKAPLVTVGLHIAKVSNAPFSRYLATAAAFYRLKELQWGRTIRKVLYVATDDPAVAEEVEISLEGLDYAISMDICLSAEKIKDSNITCTDPMRQELISALTMARVDFYVGASAAAFGRVVYAMRAVTFPEKLALRSVLVGGGWSLPGTWPPPTFTALYSHFGTTREELKFKPGDNITLAPGGAALANRSARPFPDELLSGVDADGNRGLFPRFKVK